MQAIGEKIINFFPQLYTLSMRDTREGGNQPLARRLFLKRAFRYRTFRFPRSAHYAYFVGCLLLTHLYVL